MVYCGRPSKGCATCRAKRTKCDTKQPSCTQCLRKGLICPGYRDETALAFRDQTEQVVSKRSSPSSSRKASPSSISRESSAELIPLHSTSTVPFSLGPSLEEQATTFFFQQYVWQDHVFYKGSWDFMPGVFTEEGSASAVVDAIQALGLAGLSNARRETLPQVPAAKYTRALRHVNAALRDPVEAKSDRTLIVVELLSLYELANSGNGPSMAAWSKHIDGATALLRLRGKGQFATRLGRRLYVQLRSQILLSCAHRCLPAPDFVKEWAGEASDNPDWEGEQHAAALVPLSCRLCDAQADLYRNPSYPVEAALQVLSALDADFEDWAMSSPSDNNFTIHYVPEDEPCPEMVFQRMYHEYKGYWTAILWNHYRSTRMLLQGLLMEQYQRLADKLRFPQDLSQSPLSVPLDNSDVYASTNPLSLGPEACMRAVAFCLRSLAIEVTGSVPFFLSYGLESPNQGAAGSSKSVPNTSKPYKISVGTANLMLWPLYAVGAATMDSLDIFDWTLAMLTKMSDETGLVQGRAIAALLASRQRWSRGWASGVVRIGKREGMEDENAQTPGSEDKEKRLGEVLYNKV